jgi:hypothetical protein
VIALLIVVSPIVLAVLAVSVVCWAIAYAGLHCAVWLWWNPRGIDVLFVYSNSPVWQEHIETEVLPLLGARAIVLNWSERRDWRLGLASAIFWFFGGQREFNPLAVVCRPFRRAQVFRFWQPFKAWKHGRVEALERVEAAFWAAIGSRVDHTAA